VGLATPQASTPLIAAVQGRERARLQALLAAGVDVNEPNDKGVTALKVAADINDVNTLNTLILAGANPGAKSGDGKTALHIAESRGHAACSIALRAAGAGVGAKDRTARNDKTPVQPEQAAPRSAIVESGERVPLQSPITRSGKRVPRPVRDEITKLVSLGGGDQERLKKLIELCKAYDQGRSTLSEARRVCNSRYWLFAKDLDNAIEAWQPPHASPGFLKRLFGHTTAQLQQHEAQVPPGLREEVMRFVNYGYWIHRD
jgi:hypothetical protein